MTLRQMARENWQWSQGYKLTDMSRDATVGLILAILLVPQSLAYALLAGLPAHVGLYASIFPLVAYALFASSRFLAVGPTAIISLMTAGAIASFPEGQRLAAAGLLALMSGGLLIGLGLMKAGAISNFLSRSVVTAYIAAAGILIMISQLKHVLGVDASGKTALGMIKSIWNAEGRINPVTMALGLGTVLFLFVFRRYVYRWIRLAGLKRKPSKIISRLSPVFAVIICTVLVGWLRLDASHGVRVLDDIPSRIPTLTAPPFDFDMVKQLVVAAFVIAVIGFVDSVSIAQTFAARTRTEIDPNKELFGLGAANVIAGSTGAFPVAGSLSRSAIAFKSQARSPVAGLVCAALMLLSVIFLLPLLKYLPLAALAGLIIFACFSLLNFSQIWRTWQYSRGDGLVCVGTFLSVLLLGVEYGVLVGTVLSMIFHIRLTLKPHVVLVGRLPGTEHYRDVDRYVVETDERVKTLRIDESLYFANARFLEDTVAKLVAKYPKMEHLILMCPSINRIDASALDSLVEINKRLEKINVKLHLSEVHSHVMDRLHRSNFFEYLTGQVFLYQQEAIEALQTEPDWTLLDDHVDMH